MYSVFIQPFDQNRIKLNSIISPKNILNVAKGAELVRSNRRSFFKKNDIWRQMYR